MITSSMPNGRAFVGSNGKVHEDLRAIVVDTMPEHLR